MNVRKVSFVISLILLCLSSYIQVARAFAVSDSIEDSRNWHQGIGQKHPEDSIMRVAFPELFTKPRFAVASAPQRSFSYSERWHFTPNDATRKDFLIIAEKNICDTLLNELRIYSEDVHAIYGYGVYLVSVEGATPAQLRSLIISYQSNLCGVLLVGDVGEAWFESYIDWEYEYDRWPCDLYFADLDGTWTDSDNNGIYDGHSGNQNPDIFVARLSGVGLSGLGSESALIKRQLAKSHGFWWKASFQSSDTVLNYVGKNMTSGYLSQSLNHVFDSCAVVDVRYGENPSFSSADFLSRLNSGEYGYTQLVCHSSTTMHEITIPWVNVSQVINNTSSNIGITLFCCYACYWKSSQPCYIGGAHLFNMGKTMAVIGSTKKCAPGGERCLYNAFADMNLGEAYLHWWTHVHQDTHNVYDIRGDYGLTILGDPAINFRHNVSDYCVSDLVLSTFPQGNVSNLVLFRAGNSITVSQNFVIPANVHVVFDAPTVTISPEFTCPVGASFEIRNEGCEL